MQTSVALRYQLAYRCWLFRAMVAVLDLYWAAQTDESSNQNEYCAVYGDREPFPELTEPGDDMTRIRRRRATSKIIRRRWRVTIAA
jgi:hypothetical protein